MSSDSATVSRGLEIGADQRALTFTELEPTVSEVFHKANVLYESDAIHKKDLPQGASSTDFPMTGKDAGTPSEHTAGTFIEGVTDKQAKVNIELDEKPLILARRIPYVDEAVSSWNLVEQAARKNARGIAEMIDRRLFVVAANAARTAAVTDIHDGGNTVQRVAASLAAAYPVSDTGASNFEIDASNLARQWDEDDVPEDGRFLYVSPYIRQVLTRSDKLMSRDYADRAHGYAPERVIGMLEGFMLIMTQHLPNSDITGQAQAAYNGNFAVDGDEDGQSAAIALYNGAAEGEGAVGSVNPVGGAMRSVVYWDENREANFVKSRFWNGSGVVEPWKAGEIQVHDGG